MIYHLPFTIDYELKFIVTESYPTRPESYPNRNIPESYSNRNIDYVYTAPLVRDLYNRCCDHTHE